MRPDAATDSKQCPRARRALELFLHGRALALLTLLPCLPAAAHGDGVIGRLEEEGMPVVFRFEEGLPSPENRLRFSWLTVIAWAYDGSRQNGMPSGADNERMLALERALEVSAVADLCRHAYSRTGNDLKEMVYYCSSREAFLGAFNAALQDHPRYPVTITFYRDRHWVDLGNLLETFREAR